MAPAKPGELDLPWLKWLLHRAFLALGWAFNISVENAAAADAHAAADRARAEELARRKKKRLAAAMKGEGRLDRLALVYYVESALKAGGDGAAIALALKEKGWPAEQVEAALQCCRESGA